MPYGTANVDVIQSSTTGTPVQFNDGSGTQIGTLCRAWVNSNGTTSPGTVRASFNVTSVTKNATGNYTVNFTNAFADANYGIAISTGSNVSNNQGLTIASRLTSSVGLYSYNNSSVLSDSDYCGVSIFG